MKKAIITSAFLIQTLACTAQSPTPSHSWENLYEQLSDYDDVEDNNLEDMYERLCELEANPINLNNATNEDLQQLSFLSAQQLEELAEYIYRYRPLRSMGELAMVESMDPLRLQLMRHFTFVGETAEKPDAFSLKNALKYGKNELVATVKVPFYERKGDKNGYLGYKYKHWFRYKFSYGQYIQAGITGSQDAGEPFFSNRNNLGYDHYSYYLLMRKLGPIKTLALGQYKLKLGLGLIMNTGFSFGKTTTLAMSNSSNTISANSSRSDAYYLQGTAATVAITRHIDATAFASYRKIDATLNDDGNIRTILKTGYHRTESEMLRKQNASQLAAGGSLQMRKNGFHAGANAIFTSFNRTLAPDHSQLFRRYNPEGKNFWNASVNYGYISHRVNINGETAINDANAVATLNSIAYNFSPSLTVTAIQRYYSYKYYSLFSSSFSDGGHIQNESGIYAGIAWAPLPRLSILAYTDYAYFPWARYQVSAASHSWDNMLQATYNMQKFTLLARYRIRLRQKDAKPTDNEENDLTTLTNKTEHRSRIALSFDDNSWHTKTQADIAYCADTENSFGWMLSQSVAYKYKFIDASANINYFNTHDYDSRLYAYERGVLYNFSFPMFYGRGMRFALSIKANINKNLMMICKAGTTKYFDRDHISSSYQQIDSSVMTDLDLQIKWRF